MHPVHIDKPSANEHAPGVALMQQKNLDHNLASYILGGAEYYITIRIRQLPSQQALQKSYESQRMQPCQLSHCATCAFLFENVMSCLIFIYLSDASKPDVVTCGFSFEKLASLA